MKEFGVLYTRVSSDPQEEQGFSIPAQKKFGCDYAAKNNIEIVKIFSESHTGRKPGRPEYNEMLDYVKKNKKIKHVIVEQNNRLLRNEYDSAVIIQLATSTDLSFHIIKDKQILNKYSTPMDFFLFTMNSAISSIYPRNLSRDVKKGLYEKAEEGYYPGGRTPVGYKIDETIPRHKRTKRPLAIDEDKAIFVKEAFRLYDTGMYSFQTLADKLAKDGFYPHSKPCAKNNIEDILKNPIYYGEFRFNGRIYKGIHEPLISKELFKSVQRRIENAGSPAVTLHDFLYKGLIKCSHTGQILSGDKKTGANKSGVYIYYRCTHKCPCGKRCKALKEKHINEFVESIIRKIDLSKEQIDIVLEKIKSIYKSKNDYDNASIEKLQKEIVTLKNRLNNLYIDKLDGNITEEFYQEKQKEWHALIDEKDTHLKNIMASDKYFIEKANDLLELSKNAYQWYSSQSNENKRKYLKMVCSNFFYDGENLTIITKNTFRPMLESVDFNNGGR